MIVVILLVFALALGMAVVGAIVRAIGRLLRFAAKLALLACAAVLGARALGSGFAAAGADAAPAILLGAIGVPPLLWAWQRLSHPAAAMLSTQPLAADREDHPLAAAWAALAALVPRRGRAAVAAARSRCTTVLAAAAADPMDLELIACAVLVRRSVPDLAARTAMVWPVAGRERLRALQAEVIDSVGRIGTHAEAVLARSRPAPEDALLALRNHLAARTGTGA